MGLARCFAATAVALLLVLVPSSATADGPGDGLLPDPNDPSNPSWIERVVYEVYGTGGDVGDAKCVRVSSMGQDAPMTVHPYLSPSNVGVEGGLGAPLGVSVVVMLFPAECTGFVVDLYKDQEQDVYRLLP